MSVVMTVRGLYRLPVAVGWNDWALAVVAGEAAALVAKPTVSAVAALSDTTRAVARESVPPRGSLRVMSISIS
jgi:hypothetical protein